MVNLAKGQFFIPLQDASGAQLSLAEQSQLNQIAGELVALLPSGYQDEFQIFDLGVYRMQQYYAGGVSEIVSQAISGTDKDYSLYIWYVLNDRGEFEMFADYLFPDGEFFQCFDTESENQVRERIDLMRLSNRSLTRFEQEKRMIEFFISVVEQLEVCCVLGNETGCIDCDIMPSDIKILMEEREALEFDLSILLPSTEVVNPESYITYYSGNPEIEIEGSGNTRSIYEIVRDYLSIGVFSNGVIKAYITTDSNLCDIKISEILSDTGSMYFLWVHVSSSYDKLWFYNVDNVMDEIVVSGCGTRQRSGGIELPCMDAYFVVNHPLHDTIDKYVIGYWIDEIFTRNGLDNISASVTNDDGGFRAWHDLWIETKSHTGVPLPGHTDIDETSWVFYREHRSREHSPGGTYLNVPVIENCLECPTDRHQVYAIIAAHEYGHQLFSNARYLYSEILEESRLIKGTVKNEVHKHSIHSYGLMINGKNMVLGGIIDYINSPDPRFIFFNESDIKYLKKYLYFYSRYQEIQSMVWPDDKDLHLGGLKKDVKKYASTSF